MSTIISFLPLILGIIGAIKIQRLLDNNVGIFGIGKAYLVVIVFCGAFASNVHWAIAVLAILLSYGLSVLLTRRVNPLNWVSMLLVGFGFTVRLIMRIFGVALPYMEAKAIRDYQESQRAEAERQAMEREREEIQREAYRRFGQRGQVNSDNTYWRPDEESDWIKVHKK